MSLRRALEVRSELQSSLKWSVALCEDAFRSFYAQGGEAVQRIFGQGSLFSPLLFEKFFDPADAFPLWEFESDVLLSGDPRTAKSGINWSESDKAYAFRAELPVGARNVKVMVCGDEGKVVEISGRWNGREAAGREWRNRSWWEYGFVRRLELPENADGAKMAAFINSEITLEINIPKSAASCSASQLNDLQPKESEDA